MTVLLAFREHDIQLATSELQGRHLELLRKDPIEQAEQVLASSQTRQFLRMEPQFEQIFPFRKNPEWHLKQIELELHLKQLDMALLHRIHKLFATKY